MQLGQPVFCIARPIRFVVSLELNIYDDDDDEPRFSNDSKITVTARCSQLCEAFGSSLETFF